MCEYDLVIPVTSKCKDHSTTSPATITTLTATTTASKTTTLTVTATASKPTTTATTSERKAQGDDTTTTEKSISNKIVFSPLASIYTIFFGLSL